MCGTPQLFRSITTSFCKPGTRIVPCSCGNGRYTNHQTTAATTMTTRAINQDKSRRKDRNLTPIAKANGQSRVAARPAQRRGLAQLRDWHLGNAHLPLLLQCEEGTKTRSMIAVRLIGVIVL